MYVRYAVIHRYRVDTRGSCAEKGKTFGIHGERNRSVHESMSV